MKYKQVNRNKILNFLQYAIKEKKSKKLKDVKVMKDVDENIQLFFIPVKIDISKTREELLKEYNFQSQIEFEDYVLLNPDKLATEKELNKMLKEGEEGEIFYSFILYGDNLIDMDKDEYYETDRHINSKLDKYIAKDQRANKIYKTGESNTFSSNCILVKNINYLIVFSKEEFDNCYKKYKSKRKDLLYKKDI